MGIVFSLWRCLQRFWALRNRVASSLEASPVPVSIFTVQSLIGQQGVRVCVRVQSHVERLSVVSSSRHRRWAVLANSCFTVCFWHFKKLPDREHFGAVSPAAGTHMWCHHSVLRQTHHPLAGDMASKSGFYPLTGTPRNTFAKKYFLVKLFSWLHI